VEERNALSFNMAVTHTHLLARISTLPTSAGSRLDWPTLGDLLLKANPEVSGTARPIPANPSRERRVILYSLSRSKIDFVAIKAGLKPLISNNGGRDVSEMFGNVGQVESVQIITDRDTGRSKGFGFVQMTDDAARRKGYCCVKWQRSQRAAAHGQ
jgi:hypothetical protein